MSERPVCATCEGYGQVREASTGPYSECTTCSGAGRVDLAVDSAVDSALDSATETVDECEGIESTPVKPIRRRSVV